jgi:hypothetical protein
MSEQEHWSQWNASGPGTPDAYWVVGYNMRIVATCQKAKDCKQIEAEHNRIPVLELQRDQALEVAMVLNGALVDAIQRPLTLGEKIVALAQGRELLKLATAAWPIKEEARDPNATTQKAEALDGK